MGDAGEPTQSRGWRSSPAAPPASGCAISERLAADGMAVAVFDRDGEAAEQAAEKIAGAGDRALSVTVDVTDRAQIDAGVAQVRGEFGPADGPGQQRRRPRRRSVPEDHAREVAASPRREPHRHVQLLPGRGARHGRRRAGVAS